MGLTNPDGAARVVAKITGLDLAIARTSLDHHFFQVAWPPETAEHLKATAKFLVDQGLITEVPTITPNPDFLSATPQN